MRQTERFVTIIWISGRVHCTTHAMQEKRCTHKFLILSWLSRLQLTTEKHKRERWRNFYQQGRSTNSLSKAANTSDLNTSSSFKWSLSKLLTILSLWMVGGGGGFLDQLLVGSKLLHRTEIQLKGLVFSSQGLEQDLVFGSMTIPTILLPCRVDQLSSQVASCWHWMSSCVDLVWTLLLSAVPFQSCHCPSWVDPTPYRFICTWDAPESSM